MGRVRSLAADVAIVGGGPAGITLAHHLEALGRSVVIIEAGGVVGGMDGDLHAGVATGPVLKDFDSYLVRSRRSGVGGSGAGWGVVGRPWLMPLCPWDLGPRPWVAGARWPLAPAELERLYRRATILADLPDGPEAHESWTDADSGLRPLCYRFPSDPGFLRARFEGLVNPSVLGAVVTAIDVADGVVQRLRAVGPEDQEVSIVAEHFVLAAGGIENARILLVGGADRSLPEPSPATGRSFMEHPHVVVGRARVPTAEIEPFAPRSRSQPLVVLGLTEDVQRAMGLLNATVQLMPRSPVGEEGHVECDLFLRAEQEPNDASRIDLGSDVDRFGRPRPRLRWRPTARDWTSIVRSAEVVADVLDRRPTPRPRPSRRGGATTWGRRGWPRTRRPAPSTATAGCSAPPTSTSPGAPCSRPAAPPTRP